MILVRLVQKKLHVEWSDRLSSCIGYNSTELHVLTA